MQLPPIRKNTVLITVSAVLIFFAGCYYFTHRGTDKAPVDRSSWVYFKCGNCGQRFHLTGQQIQDERQPRPSSKLAAPVFTCPKCGQQKATRDPDQTPEAG